MSAVGANFGMKVPSYQAAPLRATRAVRVRYPATSGTPRKMPTLRAIPPIETSTAVASAPIQPGTTLRKKYPSSEYVRI